VKQQAAAVEDGHFVADALDVGNDVRGDHGRGFVLVDVISDGIVERAACGRIETVGGLVKQDQTRPTRQRETDQGPAALPFAQRSVGAIHRELAALTELRKTVLSNEAEAPAWRSSSSVKDAQAGGSHRSPT